MIRIIHISDLHLESEKPSYDKLEIIKSLANDLKTYVDDSTLLFFTGDLIDKGAKEFQNATDAFYCFEKLFIDPILIENPLLKGKIFVIPGNHDVFRSKIDQISEVGLKAVLKDVKGLNTFIEENRKESKHLERLCDYKRWENDFYIKYNNYPSSNFESTFKLSIGKYKVGITALNSSWLCKDDSDKENILLGVPTDYLEDNDIFNFNVSFIQNFNSNEIKQLITKWFAGTEVDLKENMQKLIKSFIDFGLPKTPLTITLFLWIFEKQEKRPINSSSLVEMFIENLLEKTNIENIYSETFDFKNKRRLLSFVSKFMRDKGNEDLSYSVDYVDLLSYMKEYLKTRFAGQPQKVLDDLIRRGILTYEDDNLIRFKSAFFFHYFLALHMDYDPNFKEHVFTGENYLNYIEEIGYYTGLKRDDLGVLNFTQEKLHLAFGSFNENIKNNYQKVDAVLESKQKEGTVTFQIDKKVAESKLSEKQLDEMYDNSLSNIPVQKSVPKKDFNEFETRKNIDLVLKLAATVLKNSEDVDDFEAKKIAYSNTLTSSISFLMQYRDSLIIHYHKFQKQPDHFPKNIDFNLFIKIIPLIQQVVMFNWLGTQKLRPVIIDKIEKDKLTLNISEFEKSLSVFMHSDVRGTDYPEVIKEFVKKSKYNYIKDLSFLKIMSYYHLRTNGKELDTFYLKLMADIKEDIGSLDKTKKSQFMKEIENKKKNN